MSDSPVSLPLLADRVLAPITTWARSRPDILALALVGSWARGMAREDSDIDLIVLAERPHEFRGTTWLNEIQWTGLAGWRDAEYGAAWSRHIGVLPRGEIELTFCAPAWAAVDPIDAGTLRVVSGGCRIVLDKSGLFERLLAAVSA